ncbi:putative methyltransferase DDB_G0268948 [Physella acuta]|uniref:putative methyltransferase DDB_G0268948 n=1 Tax=Physella acuta TaxID=109671 RepID=UPI0027DBB803|nr:putative methyltransferase DDB_G0268948 [Physella acuta]
MLNHTVSKLVHLENCLRRLKHIVYPMSKFSSATLFTDEKQTQLYAKFRPTYTDEIFKRIIEFCKEGDCDFQLAVDVGCGSGQSTIPLAQHFNKVIGADVSQQQIANAPNNISNVSFHVSAADELSFIQSSSVDLLTIAQALHWLDLSKFYKEVSRVLKPGASLVAYGYGVCQVEPEKAGQIFSHIYNDVLPDYWAEGRKMVEEKYMSLELPYPGWRRDDSLSIKKVCSVADFIGYMGSWSAVTNYNKSHPTEDLLGLVEKQLNNSFDPETEDKVLKVEWPVFMLMGKKPK